MGKREPNELFHPIARKLITSFSEKISIKSNIEIIKGFFPEKTCLEQVLNVLKNKNVDFMIFSLCDLLNWLNVIQINRSCREFIDDIINKINAYYSVILSVETNNPKNIDAIVSWSKNYGPLIPKLDAILVLPIYIKRMRKTSNYSKKRKVLNSSENIRQ